MLQVMIDSVRIGQVPSATPIKFLLFVGRGGVLDFDLDMVKGSLIIDVAARQHAKNVTEPFEKSRQTIFRGLRSFGPELCPFFSFIHAIPNTCATFHPTI